MRELVQAAHIVRLVADAAEEFARLEAELLGHRKADERLLEVHSAARVGVVQVDLCVGGVTSIKEVHLELANLGCALGVFAVHVGA